MRPLQTWDQAEFNTDSNAEKWPDHSKEMLRGTHGICSRGPMCASRESQDGPMGTNTIFVRLRQED